MNRRKIILIITMILISCMGIYIFVLSVNQNKTISEQGQQVDNLIQDKLQLENINANLKNSYEALKKNHDTLKERYEILENSHDNLKEKYTTYEARVQNNEQINEKDMSDLSEELISKLNSANSFFSGSLSFIPEVNNRLSWFEDRNSLRYLEDTDNRYAIVSEKDGMVEVYTMMNVYYLDWTIIYKQKEEFEYLSLSDTNAMVVYNYVKLDDLWYCYASYRNRALYGKRELSDWQLVSEESAIMRLSYLLGNIEIILDNEMNVAAKDLLTKVQMELENGTLKSPGDELEYIDQTVLDFGTHRDFYEVTEIIRNEDETRINILVRAGLTFIEVGESPQPVNWSIPKTIVIKDGVIRVIQN